MQYKLNPGLLDPLNELLKAVSWLGTTRAEHKAYDVGVAGALGARIPYIAGDTSGLAE